MESDSAEHSSKYYNRMEKNIEGFVNYFRIAYLRDSSVDSSDSDEELWGPTPSMTKQPPNHRPYSDSFAQASHTHHDNITPAPCIVSDMATSYDTSSAGATTDGAPESPSLLTSGLSSCLGTSYLSSSQKIDSPDCNGNAIPISLANNSYTSSHRFDWSPLTSSYFKWKEFLREQRVSMAADAQLSITIGDVAELIQLGYGLYTGGHSSKGNPVLIFPDTPNHSELEDNQYNLLVTYLASIPSERDANIGFFLVLDRRNSKWASVKTWLSRFSVYFPGLIEVVYILRPSGFLQKHLSGIAYKLTRETFKYQVVWCDSASDLLSVIPVEYLPTYLGGALRFSAEIWIQNRAAVENFLLNCGRVRKVVEGLLVHFAETELPNDCAATESLLADHSLEKLEADEDLTSVQDHGNALVEKFSNDLAARLAHNAHVESSLAELLKTKTHLCSVWTEHEARLRDCLRLRRFEDAFRVKQSDQTALINKLKEILIEASQSSTTADQALGELDNQLSVVQIQVDEVNNLCTLGKSLLSLQLSNSQASVAPKCDELSLLIENLIEKSTCFEQDIRLFPTVWTAINKGKELVETLEERLVKYAAGRVTSPDVAQVAINDIQSVLEVVDDTVQELKPLEDKLLDYPELKAEADLTLLRTGNFYVYLLDVSKFDIFSPIADKLIDVVLHSCVMNVLSLTFSDIRDSIGGVSKNVVSELLTRLVDLTGMCNGRLTTLKPIAAAATPHPTSKPQAIVQPMPKSGGPTNSSSSDSVKPPVACVLPMQKSYSHRSRAPSLEPIAPTHVINVPDRLRNRRARDKATRCKSLADMESEAVNSFSKDDMDPEIRLSHQKHVVAELLETERTYVSELESIVRGYMDVLEDSSLSHLVPSTLLSIANRKQLFSNLREIYSFHHSVFLRDLENCQQSTTTTATISPSLFAKCFINRKEQFKLYATYCQNKPCSEALQTEIAGHAFLQECQKKLGHKLPLSAYLLKPIQRITKYQLLLREMLKYCVSNDPARYELLHALDTMLSVVRYANDVMHQVSITNYPGDLGSLGQLLLQAPFSIQVGYKRERLRRKKAVNRHVFLYEKLVLFCKATSIDTKSQTASISSVKNKSYAFKHALKTTEIGMTESPSHDPRKFELWLHGRTEVYTMQCASLEQKNQWVDQVKSILFSHLDQLKEQCPNINEKLVDLPEIWCALSAQRTLDAPDGSSAALHDFYSGDELSENDLDSGSCGSGSRETVSYDGVSLEDCR